MVYDRAVRENLWKPVGLLLAENPGMVFNEELVDRICLDHGLPFRRDEVGPQPTLEEFLATFRDQGVRHQFLAFYVVEWRSVERSRTQVVTADAS